MKKTKDYQDYLDKSLIPIDLLTFFNRYPSALLWTIGKTGVGKTLFMSIFALCYRILYNTRSVDANFPLNLTNFNYNPYSFYPYNKLNNSLLLIDDCNESKKYSKVITMSAKDKRKFSLYIILSTQYYTFIDKSLRDMSNFYFECNLSDLIIVEGFERLSDKSKLVVSLYDYVNELEKEFKGYIVIENPLELITLIPNLYDTKEKIIKPLEKFIILELIDNSQNFNDIRLNLESFYDNQNKINTIYKKLLNFSFREVKKFNELNIESMLYKIPLDLLIKRKKEGSL